MTYTEHRVLVEELYELLTPLEKADDLAKDHFWDAQPCSRDRMLAMAVYPHIDQLIELVDKRLQDLKAIESLPA